jgi:hypothetical protein
MTYDLTKHEEELTRFHKKFCEVINRHDNIDNTSNSTKIMHGNDLWEIQTTFQVIRSTRDAHEKIIHIHPCITLITRAEKKQNTPILSSIQIEEQNRITWASGNPIILTSNRDSRQLETIIDFLADSWLPVIRTLVQLNKWSHNITAAINKYTGFTLTIYSNQSTIFSRNTVITLSRPTDQAYSVTIRHGEGRVVYKGKLEEYITTYFETSQWSAQYEEHHRRIIKMLDDV